MEKKLSLPYFLMAFFLFSCSPTNTGMRKTGSLGHTNSPSSVNIGYGRIVSDNPLQLLGTTSVSSSIDYGSLLKNSQDFITLNSTLKEKCGKESSVYGAYQDDCYQVIKYYGATPLESDNGRWAYPPNSDEFWEVHTFGHIKKVINFYQDILYESYLKANPSGTNKGGKYETSIPAYLYVNKGFWNGKTLVAYSACDEDGKEDTGAYYSPYENTMCFPTSISVPYLNPIQDPQVIYHEIGHYLMQVFTNQRNSVNNIVRKAEIGFKDYDEGLALQEGLADFIAYGLTKRTHFGEWALGSFFSASRPLSEDDSLHAEGISKSDNERLSYPKYVGYDPNDPNKDDLKNNKFEIVHYTGQIASHYLTSLLLELMNYCGLSHDDAFKVVTHLLIETFAELGDLSSKQSDNQTASPSQDRVNFSNLYDRNGRSQSLLWQRVVKPTNYRSFFQTFAKKMLQNFNANNPTFACTAYTQDLIEKLLDKYGLLLFKTYNDNYSGFDQNCSLADETSCRFGHLGTLTAVNPLNRIRSKLISKDYLTLPDTNYALLVDDHDSVLGRINSMRGTQALTNISTRIPSDLRYNNGNGRFSPGEIALLLINLKNDSNYPMAGIEILGNDWDHGKLDGYDSSIPGSGTLKPCNTFSDSFPTTTEGAASTNSGSPKVGDCEHITRNNGTNANVTTDIIAPACWLQLQGENETLWVSQETYREFNGVDKNLCLEGSNYTENCFVRLIPGGDVAGLSYIAPNSTWIETFSHVDSSKKYTTNNFLFFEINPWTPPNTIVNCRFRARFTNCDECWHDSNSSNDDPLDYELSGGDPYYQIINYKFTIID